MPDQQNAPGTWFALASGLSVYASAGLDIHFPLSLALPLLLETQPFESCRPKNVVSLEDILGADTTEVATKFCR